MQAIVEFFASLGYNDPEIKDNEISQIINEFTINILVDKNIKDYYEITISFGLPVIERFCRSYESLIDGISMIKFIEHINLNENYYIPTNCSRYTSLSNAQLVIMSSHNLQVVLVIEFAGDTVYTHEYPSHGTLVFSHPEGFKELMTKYNRLPVGSLTKMAEKTKTKINTK